MGMYDTVREHGVNRSRNAMLTVGRVEKFGREGIDSQTSCVFKNTKRNGSILTRSLYNWVLS